MAREGYTVTSMSYIIPGPGVGSASLNPVNFRGRTFILSSVAATVSLENLSIIVAKSVGPINTWVPKQFEHTRVRTREDLYREVRLEFGECGVFPNQDCF